MFAQRGGRGVGAFQGWHPLQGLKGSLRWPEAAQGPSPGTWEGILLPAFPRRRFCLWESRKTPVVATGEAECVENGSLTWPRPLAPGIGTVPLPGPGVQLIRLQPSQ